MGVDVRVNDFACITGASAPGATAAALTFAKLGFDVGLLARGDPRRGGAIP